MRFVERFVADAELPAFFERADLVVLPYREIDQSGVLFTALAFGRPLVLSAVGGFPEVAEHGGARARPARRRRTRCARRCAGCSATRPRAARSATRPPAPRASRYGWDAIARAHLDLYATLLPA